MSFKEPYREKFTEAFQIEEKARDLYGYYTHRLEDKKLLKGFREIYEDEKKHVEITKAFINLLSE